MVQFGFRAESILALDSAQASLSTPVPDASTCTNVVCGFGGPAFWLVLSVFNIASIMLLVVACKAIDFKSALLEKSSPAAPPDPAAPGQPGLAPAVQSSSRVISALGGLLMVAFFWACCNVCVYWAFADANNIKPFAQGVWPLFLAGSALFLPYAFNQLKGVFSS